MKYLTKLEHFSPFQEPILDIQVNGETIDSIDLVAVSNIDSKGFIASTFDALMFFIYSFFMQDEI